MKLISYLALLVTLVLAVPAQDTPRPRITGLSHVAFYTTNPDGAKHFYTDLLGFQAGSRPGVYIIGNQTVETETQTPPHPPALLSHIAFATPDAEAMLRYLAAHGVKVPDKVHDEANGTHWFSLTDPEGTPIEFVQETVPTKPNPTAVSTQPVSSQIIHAGFVVHDRAAEDKFYRDLLGFRLYWHGGMKPERTDWVAMQVPDGRQWIEYMMVYPDTKLDAHLLGVLNHVSVGVPDMKAAAKYLSDRGWKPSDESKMQMGKDGKWQLNVYDPDGTRIELMEFKPVEKPCCAPFTAPHPSN
jgi:catechol 2,3-dioxygenase-like lactoylglutathione lyase family enzyme